MLSLNTYNYKISQIDFPWIEEVAFWFRGKKVIGEGKTALITENVVRRITAFFSHL